MTPLAHIPFYVKKRPKRPRILPPPSSEATALIEQPENCYVGRLPFELLSIIFSICERDHREEWGNDTRARHTCAGIFSRVCKHWKAIALTTPALWAVIRMRGPRAKGRAKAWLQHSMRHPLVVEMASNDLSPMKPYLILMQPHLDRIHSLKVDLTVPNHWDNGRCPYFPASFIASHHLRFLQLVSVRFHSPLESLNTVKAFPNLEKLELSGEVANYSTQFHPIVTLPRLTQVIMPKWGFQRFFLETVHMPTLRHAEYPYDGRSEYDIQVDYHGPDCSMREEGWGGLSVSCLALSTEIEDISIHVKHKYGEHVLQLNEHLHDLAVPPVTTFLPVIPSNLSLSASIAFPFPKLRCVRLVDCEGADLQLLAPRCSGQDGAGGAARLDKIEVKQREQPEEWEQWQALFSNLEVQLIGEFGGEA